jgi:glutathione reductase (NADPH)
MPGRIVFMGGGYISFELAHLARRAGAEATILEVMDRVLGIFEPELVDMLTAAFKDLGIRILVSRPVQAVEESGGGFVVRAGKDGGETFEADMVIHGAGRVPAVEGLGLDEAGVDYTPRGIDVNEYMQSTSNPDVYAAGDVAATPPPLTPVADVEGKAAAHNILYGNEKKPDRSIVPSAVFTYPPLATVGLRQSEAEEKGLEFRKVLKDTSKWSEHKRIGLKHAGAKLLLDEKNDRLLGAHILGQRSEEMINLLALAMKHGLTVTELKEMIWAYPSFGYNLRHLIM